MQRFGFNATHYMNYIRPKKNPRIIVSKIDPHFSERLWAINSYYSTKVG